MGATLFDFIIYVLALARKGKCCKLLFQSPNNNKVMTFKLEGNYRKLGNWTVASVK